MKRLNKFNFIHLNKMNTCIGVIPVLSYFQKVNRTLTVYRAQKENISIFFIIRVKDVEQLKNKGYNITSIEVPAKHYPVSILYNTGSILEVRAY